MFRQKMSVNGVRCEVAALDMPASGAHEVTIGLYLRNGLRREQPKQYGLVNLLDLYLCDRMCTLPVLEKAKETHFFTYYNYSRFQVTIGSEHGPAAARGMLGELKRLMAGEVEPEAFAIAREECVAACARYRITFRRRLVRALSNTRLRTAPLIGSVRTVRGITEDMLSRWAGTYDAPGAVCLCMTGSGAAACAEALGEPLQEEWPKEEIPAEEPAACFFLPAKRRVGAVGLSFQEDLLPESQLTAEALGFLLDDLFMEEGLSWSRAQIIGGRPVTLQVFTNADPEDPLAALKDGVSALGKLPEFITQERIAEIEEDLCRIYRTQWEDPQSANDVLGQSVLFDCYDPEALLDLRRGFLTVEGVRSAAGRLLRPERCTAVVQGTPGAVSPDEVGRILAGGQ